jgi:hypothetical protein
MATAAKRQRVEEDWETNSAYDGHFDDSRWNPHTDNPAGGAAPARGTIPAGNKKHRADNAGDTPANLYVLGNLHCNPSSLSMSTVDMITQLDAESLRSLVAAWALHSPLAQQVIRVEYNRSVLGLDLKFVPMEAEAVLASGDNDSDAEPVRAYHDVRACVNTIGEQVKVQSSYNMKKRALEALHDIALSIFRAQRSRRAVEVRQGFEQDDCITQLMRRIVGSMSPEERAGAGVEYTTYGSTIRDGLRYIHRTAVEEHVAGFYDLGLVIEALGAGGGMQLGRGACATNRNNNAVVMLIGNKLATREFSRGSVGS